MKKNLITALLLAFCFQMNSNLFGQTENPTSDLMRSNGMIYVVLGVLVIIFAGIFVYLFMIDRKLSKIEKQNKD